MIKIYGFGFNSKDEDLFEIWGDLKICFNLWKIGWFIMNLEFKVGGFDFGK